MNIREIQDRLISAETTIRELSEGRVGPAPLRAQQLPYVHTRKDRNGWGKRPGEKDQLLKEDSDAHSIYRREFWEQFEPDPTPEEISIANQVKDWVMLVDDEAERRSLQAWVRAMAGGKSFARWCKTVEHIAVMTGRRRKNRAINKIMMQLSGKTDLHDEIGPKGVLPVTPEIGDVSATLASDAQGQETGLTSWADDDAFQPIYYTPIGRGSEVEVDGDFTWAKRRNERRRQREAAKRKKEAA